MRAYDHSTPYALFQQTAPAEGGPQTTTFHLVTSIAWPGNSTINWTTANQLIANGVVPSMGPAGQIKILAGSATTQVIIDRIGWLI